MRRLTISGKWFRNEIRSIMLRRSRLFIELSSFLLKYFIEWQWKHGATQELGNRKSTTQVSFHHLDPEKNSFQRRTGRNMSQKRTQRAEEKIGRCWKRDHKSEKHDAAARWKVGSFIPCFWEFPYLHAAWNSSVESSFVRTTLHDSELIQTKSFVNHPSGLKLF